MTEPVWLEKTALLLAYAEALIRTGGLAGLRDEGLLESALARPRNLFAYEGVTDVRRLAVSYGVGILRNHPFADGNKRAAFLALAMFLNLNGFELIADPLDAGNTFFSAAAGKLNEQALEKWIAANSTHAEKQ
ncbi:MAG TPA: type II toxin-antitoxin system death-on-curing family toxin [Candidatus Angelobacter sp.]|nr:type II toxin-antitoxin system death-on-curing family toxin [Candidatus Angelobacter sp.]